MANKENSIIYICRDCGYQSVKWLGRCPDCGLWASFEEDILDHHQKAFSVTDALLGSAVKLSEVSSVCDKRSSCGMPELDRALGGGIVPGSVILIGGDPGIGKSTILMQASKALAESGRVLYISGEESAEQIKLRAARMGINSDNIYLVCETNINIAMGFVDSVEADFVIADSIQTFCDPQLSGSGGSVSQVRNACSVLTYMAKTKNIPVFIVGHVTKDGVIAGPKVLEHMVDTVLYFEGDKQHNYRILRCVKNRFGSTDEIGIFEMTEAGLVEVNNPSSVFLEERTFASGSCVVPVLEGTRIILVEVQALVAKSYLPNPRRMAAGIDMNRLMMIIAVLEKKVNISFAGKDIWVNVVGGVKITETSADLAVAAALVSSNLDVPISKSLVVMGEVGLSGEIRRIQQIDKRVSEAARLGFEAVVVPNQKVVSKESVKLKKVSALGEAINAILSFGAEN